MSHAAEETEVTGQRRRVGPVTTTTSAVAAAVLIGCWLVDSIWHVHVPAEVQGAATVVLVFIAGYLVPPRPE